MRVAHVINDVTLGGAQTLLARLAATTAGSIDHDLVVLGTRGALSHELESVFRRVSYGNYEPDPKSLLRALRFVHKVLREANAQVVHSHLPQSNLLTCIAAPRGTPHVVSIHTSSDEGFSSASRYSFRALGVLTKQIDGIVATDPTAATFARTRGLKAPISVIRNGTFVPASQPTRSPDKSFICVARFAHMKGHAYLFEAYKALVEESPDWKLRLVGPGMTTSNPELMRMLGHQGLVGPNVELLGPKDDPSDLIGRSRALIIPSILGETFPMIGSEACAMGVPVVATDVGGASEFVIHKGLLIPPASAAAILSAMRVVASLAPDAYARLGAASWEKARASFGIEQCARRYLELYKALLVSAR